MLTKPSIIQLHSLYFFKGDKIIYYGFLLWFQFFRKKENELIDKVDTETKKCCPFFVYMFGFLLQNYDLQLCILYDDTFDVRTYTSTYSNN